MGPERQHSGRAELPFFAHWYRTTAQVKRQMPVGQRAAGGPHGCRAERLTNAPDVHFVSQPET